MICRGNPTESSFRSTARGREPIASAGAGTHLHHEPRRSAGVGCITSREPRALTFFEELAFALGCNVETARRAYQEGLVK